MQKSQEKDKLLEKKKKNHHNSLTRAARAILRPFLKFKKNHDFSKISKWKTQQLATHSETDDYKCVPKALQKPFKKIINEHTI